MPIELPKTTLERPLVLEARNLTKVYRMGEVDVHALRGVDFALRESELVGRIEDLIHRNYLIETFYERLAAYYVLFTWSFDSFRNLVYLRMLGEYGSGKTELMQIIGYCCRRLILLSGVASDAALFRTMHIYKGTLFIDEGDKSYSDTDSPYVKILNTGDRKGFPVVRMRDTGNAGRYRASAEKVEPGHPSATCDLCLAEERSRVRHNELFEAEIAEAVEIGRPHYEAHRNPECLKCRAFRKLTGE